MNFACKINLKNLIYFIKSKFKIQLYIKFSKIKNINYYNKDTYLVRSWS